MSATTINRVKTISIWGSTGSIGRQTLDVVNRFPDRFDIVALTAHSNTELLLEQARRFHPQYVVVTGDNKTDVFRKHFKRLDVELLAGQEGLLAVAGIGGVDLTVNALVGSAGLEATLRALESNSSIGLANKEVLVMAGELVMTRARENGLNVFPIDSEHSAIFQCLRGEKMETVNRILLTASGGPFFHKNVSEFEAVTVDDALAHPNWSMGRKVTIDSATMMNKGLEVIEAHWLFDLRPEQIDVVIHPQSIVHSMVEFKDGSIKAQLGIPDMRIPIAYALTCPDRWAGDYGSMDFSNPIQMSFVPPERNRFPALFLAYDALKIGGTAPAVLNGADEVAVQMFLNNKIKFTRIPVLIEKALAHHRVQASSDLQVILDADRWARDFVRSEINKL